MREDSLGNIMTLKVNIECKNKEILEYINIWVMSDDSSRFIAKQYINKIREAFNLNIKYIDNLKNFQDTGFVEDDNLYIYEVDKLEEFIGHDNLIVICNKCNNKLSIKFPKLEKWQFEDYLYFKLPGMNKGDIKWLLKLYEVTYDRSTQVNFERLDKDTDKISIFNVDEQSKVFDSLYSNGEYNTISNLTLFDLSDALIKRDRNLALKVLKVFDYIDSRPPMLLLSIILNNFRNILCVQSNPNAKAADLGISDKQLFVIKKYNTGHYSIPQLVNIVEFLTSMEYKYKFGGLDQKYISDYIICKILSA